jgi:hypothetical protein
MIIISMFSFGLILITICSVASVFAQSNQTNQTTATGNQTAPSNVTTTTSSSITSGQAGNVTHGGGPGAGATNQSER